MAFCFVLNRLLGRERWARDRLVRFAGEALELRLPLASPIRISITADGEVQPDGPTPAAAITLGGVRGDTPLADELRFLARHLRWDAEEELSRIVGDVAAQRLASGLHALVRWQRDAAERLTETAADYASDERRALVRRPELQQLADDLARLREALAALEQRIARLD